MKTTIDAAGRVVIPKAIRDLAGLRPGMPLEVRWQDGAVAIEPATLPTELVQRGRLLVAVPEDTRELLTAEAVDATRRALAQERGRHE